MTIGFRSFSTALVLLACLAGTMRAQTTLFSDNFAGGSTSLTYANLASITAHGAATDATLGDAYQVQAGNLSVLLALFPHSVSLGSTTGDYVRLNLTLRTESNPSGYFRLGLFDDAGTVWSSANGDDTGYNADFGSTKSAWYATGGPAYYLTVGTPSTNAPGTSLQRALTTTAAVMFQLQLTRTDAGATFTLHRGTVASGPTTLVYSLDHATPVTEFDEFAILTQNARNYWLDDLSVTTGNSLSAVPEPSTYAALAGVGALGLVVWRRRNRPERI
jgi:hypothetical protein